MKYHRIDEVTAAELRYGDTVIGAQIFTSKENQSWPATVTHVTEHRGKVRITFVNGREERRRHDWDGERRVEVLRKI